MLELQNSMAQAGTQGAMADALRSVPPEEGVEINYNEFIAAAMCR